MQRFQETKIALGSEAILTLVSDDIEHMKHVMLELWRQIADFEQRFSRFSTSSELTHVNNFAGTATEISAEMAELLAVAKKFSQETDGLFNPFILPHLVKAGYDFSWTTKETSPNISATSVPTIDNLIITHNIVTIPLNSALDLGGIGKGYLLDRLSAYLKNKINSYWLSLGGDIIANGTDVDGQCWRIGITSSDNDHLTVAQVTLPSTEPWSVATSGTNRRRGIHDGRDWHHIIDPRTSHSAKTDISSITICSPSATAADVWASCAIILGASSFSKQSSITNYLIQQKIENKPKIIVKGHLITEKI